MKNVKLLISILSVLLFGLTSCEPTNTKINVDSLSLDKEEIMLFEGANTTLVASILPENATNKNIEWKSLDETVATVIDGTVTATGVGTTRVSATSVDGSYSDLCKVTVLEREISGIELDITKVQIDKSKTLKLTATISPEGSQSLPLVWSSTDKNVASVDNTGLVTAHKGGAVTITVAAEADWSISATCQVDVYAKVESVKMSLESKVMNPEETFLLEANILPEDASNKNLTWSSSNNTVASVDQNGIVTAHTLGDAKIAAVAEDGGIEGICQINVEEKVIVLTPRSYVDEFGINHGDGIEIDNLLWAPVNCGYEEDDFTYGKLYQWGRPYGQGYNKNEAEGTLAGDMGDTYERNRVEELVIEAVGVSAENADKIYVPKSSLVDDWCTDRVPNLSWKAEYDPCPDGWRVPTSAEITKLSENHSDDATYKGQNGIWFSGSQEYSTILSDVIFIPMAGKANGWGYSFNRGGSVGMWTSDVSGTKAIELYVQGESYIMVQAVRRGESGYIRCVKEVPSE